MGPVPDRNLEGEEGGVANIGSGNYANSKLVKTRICTLLRTLLLGFMFPYRTYLHQARHSGCLEHSQVLVTSGVLASQSMQSALSVPEALLASTVHYVRFILLPSCYVKRKLA